jgi:hypothetical protein
MQQRNVDDSVDIINADIVIDAEHADDIIATEQSAMNDKTRKEYRNRIKRYYKWLEVNYPPAYKWNAGTSCGGEEQQSEVPSE